MAPLTTRSLLLGAFSLLTLLNSPCHAADDTSALKRKLLWISTGLGELNTGPNGGLNGMPSSRIESITRKPWGRAPETCVGTAIEADKNNGGKKRCEEEDLQIWGVKYADCGIEAVMCVCKTAQVSIHEVAYEFGKVPVRARQWVRHIAVMPDTSCHAWAWMGGEENNIVILGPCHNSTSLYLHEVGHCLDAAGGRMKGSYSQTAGYQNVVNGDGCISDRYAHNSWADNFAQVAVMATYHRNVRSIWTHEIDAGCMQGAINNVVGLLGTAIQHGGVCEGGLPVDNDVCVGKKARAQGLCEGIPDKAKNHLSSEFDKRETHQLGPKLTEEERKNLEEINRQIKHDDLEHIYETGPGKRSIRDEFIRFVA
ncbi:hypothetical protein QBC35DRAFT_467782 [Podospora australis]|uniref:Conidiation-specific protein n=1 Tax=Podospora australis TaxID=1536484 RepID=A0AAN6WK34_9PEZI|nr:hypothetical protein QBC35DRAFT_467782 [Podospora australis]